MNRQQAFEWIENNGRFRDGDLFLIYPTSGSSRPYWCHRSCLGGINPNYTSSVSKIEYDQYLKDKVNKMKDQRICIDVSDFDIEKKKRVQDAFFKLGFKWSSGNETYLHLDKEEYTSIRTGDKNTHDYLLYGDSISEDEKEYQVTYDELMEVAGRCINARDKTYSGIVSKWGLPDGTVITNGDGVLKVYRKSTVVDSVDLLTDKSLTSVKFEYKIKSLPAGYEFNEAGEIVEVEVKRYWKGKDEPIDVGMWFKDSEGKDRRAEFVNGDDVAFRYNNGIGCVTIRSCKPIDTRTDKERVVDDLMAGVSIELHDRLDAIREEFGRVYDTLIEKVGNK